MAEMNSGISDISTTIDESSQGVNDAADSVGGIVDSINDIEKMLQKYGNRTEASELCRSV